MKDWKDAYLADLAELQRGFDITKAQQHDGTVPIISSSGISSFHNQAKCKAPGVITGRKGTLGKVFYSPIDYWPHDTTLWIKNYKSNSPRYTYYFLQLLKLESYDVGASNPTLNRNHIHKLKIRLPRPGIQRKIAAVLSAYDDLIENNNRRIAILEKMAEELYREWFVRLRFPGHEKVKIVKGVPEGWEVKDSLAVFHVLGGGTPKTENPAFWDGDIPFFTPKDSHTGYFANVTEKSITPSGLESCNSKLYGKNTIFITARGTVGNIVLALRPMAMNQSCYALVPKSGKHIYFHFLSMRNAVNIIKGTANSGVFDNIITDSFKQIKLFQPQEKLMGSFSDKASRIMDQIENIVGKNTLLTTSRDRLLSRLMSGKIDVENMDIRFPESMKEEGVAHA